MKILIVFIVYQFLNTLQLKSVKTGSDHFYHLALINSIKGNKNKFVTAIGTLVGHKYFAYPQGFHWLVSLLPRIIIQKYYSFIGVVIGYLSLFIVLAFFAIIYSLLPQTNFSQTDFCFYAGMLFVTTPFSYATWNAKNVGISARGIGLFLGMGYVMTLFLYLYMDNVQFLILCYLIAYLVLITSQFASQFVILFSVVAGLVFGKPLIILSPFIAFIFFYFFHRKVAIQFIYGQYWHKWIYFNFRDRLPIFLERYSIWRDLVWDIWIRLKRPLEGFEYAIKNSFIAVLLGMPYVAFLTYYIGIKFIVGDEGYYSIFMDSPLNSILVKFSLISIGIFFLISFRLTRFLGEPERYIEFLFPLLIVLTLFVSENDIVLIYILLGWNISYTFVQLLGPSIKMFYKRKTDKGYIKGEEFLKMVVKQTEKIVIGENERIFSNNLQLNKFFLGSRYNVLFPSITYPYTGPFHFTKLFTKDYAVIDIKVVSGLIKHFKISWFLYDCNLNNGKDLDLEFLVEVERINNIIIYSVNLEE